MPTRAYFNRPARPPKPKKTKPPVSRAPRPPRAFIQHNKKQLRLIINLIKCAPCAECHKDFHVECMDFDHVRGKKLENVSAMVTRNAPLWQVLIEIAKCDLVCSNCHRLRTAIRNGQLACEQEVPYPDRPLNPGITAHIPNELS